MSSLVEALPLILGTPANEYQTETLYMLAGVVTVICILFFLKLFLLIGNPKR